MRRREALVLLGGAVAWPLRARGQASAKARLVAVLFGTPNDADGQARLAAFREGLAQSGLAEESDIRLEIRWGGGDEQRTAACAKELVSLAPDVILASSTVSARVLQRQGYPGPVVFAVVSDPVGEGFVESLPRPGRNMTGFSSFDPAIAGKWLDALKAVAPAAQRVGIFYNPKTAPGFSPLAGAGADPFNGMEKVPLPVEDVALIEPALASLAREPGTVLVVLPDGFTTANRDIIIRAAAAHRLPAMYPFPVFARAGGLMSYGIDTPEIYRRAAAYVDRVLKGVKPAELPVQLPTKFQLLINLRTANALGLTVPPSLLARADEVIE
jgi:putative ABC transport system substrate-binding protein